MDGLVDVLALVDSYQNCGDDERAVGHGVSDVVVFVFVAVCQVKAGV